MRKFIVSIATGVMLFAPTLQAFNFTAADYDAAVKAARDMFEDIKTNRLVEKYGLNLTSVTWEDTGRFKNSSGGPNISDMSIQAHVPGASGEVTGYSMPVIRYGNFDDKTADIPMNKFNVLVGNENGTALKAITLSQYLSNFRSFLHNPRSWAGNETSLLSPRDTHALVSPQVSFMPVPKGGIAKFNPVLFNYQSYEDNPAVLAILVTSEGTSATVIDNTRDGFSEGDVWGQRLFFNKNGNRASLTAQRVSDVKPPKTDPNKPAPAPHANGTEGMNMVMLIQVPLKYKPQPYDEGDYGCGDSNGEYECEEQQEESGGVEDAVIGHGELEGIFTEIDNLKIERDHRFPVRITLQFYKATDVSTLTEAEMKSIRAQIDKVYKGADYVGSLVTEGTTIRPTEHTAHCQYPDWWDSQIWPIKAGAKKYTRADAERAIAKHVSSGNYGWWYWCSWFDESDTAKFKWGLEMAETGNFTPKE